MRSTAALAALALLALCVPAAWADAPVVAAEVSTSTAVLGEPVTFTDATTGDGAPFTATWTDSNGRSVVGRSVTMRFDFAGVHTIGLSVADASGALVGAIEVQVTVLAPLMSGRGYAFADERGAQADTGEVATNAQGERRASVGDASRGALRAAALDAEVITLIDAQGARAVTRADAGLVHIPHPLGFLHITGAEAEAVSGCGMRWAFSDVAKVRLNDAPLVPPGEVAPNTRVELPGGGAIVLNAQEEPAPGRLAVTAARVLLPGQAPIEVARAEAGIAHCPWTGAAAAAPPVANACPGAHAPVLFAPWETQLENLVFDGAGALYVSDFGGDRVLRATPDGAVDIIADVPGMHGLTRGPDGLLYLGATGPDGAPAVLRMPADDPEARAFVATGLVSANGMAFGPDGALFVSNPGLGDGGPYLVRVDTATGAWTEWSDDYGVNGVWAEGDRLYAAVTADQSSTILSISAIDPDDVRVVAQPTLGVATLQPGAHAPAGGPGVVPKGFDDLTYHDGFLYAAAHVAGEIVRIDPATGDACVLASGLEEPTSVRVAQGFGAWDGMLFVTDMGGTAVTALFGPGEGAIWAIEV